VFCEFGDNHFGNSEVSFWWFVGEGGGNDGGKVKNNQMYGGSGECL
jgi:hypothetical protein